MCMSRLDASRRNATDENWLCRRFSRRCASTHIIRKHFADLVQSTLRWIVRKKRTEHTKRRSGSHQTHGLATTITGTSSSIIATLKRRLSSSSARSKPRLTTLSFTLTWHLRFRNLAHCNWQSLSSNDQSTWTRLIGDTPC